MRRVLLLLLAGALALLLARLLDGPEPVARTTRAPAAPAVSQPAVDPPEPASATDPRAPAPTDGAAEDPAAPTRKGPLPDPVETGPCTLFLRAVDAESDEPVAARVELWRLDAPGTEHWTDGDQRQAVVEVPVAGARVEELPADRYRVFVTSAREGAADPEPFFVSGGRTEATVPVERPLPSAVRVRLLDPSGVALTRCRRRPLSRGWSVRRPLPDWRRARTRREPATVVYGHGGGVSMSSTGRRTMRAGPDGAFLLGEFPGDTRDRRRNWTTRLRPKGCLDVHADFASLESDLLLEAVCVPARDFEGLVRMPDGRDAERAGATVMVWIDAVPVDRDAPPGTTRDAPVRVRAWLDGHETVEAEFSRHGPVPALVLRPEADG